MIRSIERLVRGRFLGKSRSAARIREAVEALVARDELSAAIALLAESSYSVDSAEMQLRLLELKWDHFQGVGRGRQVGGLSRGRTLDPFPGARGVPEISAVDLGSAVVRGAIEFHGCVLVRGLMLPGDVESLLESTQAGFREQAAWRDHYTAQGRVEGEQALLAAEQTFRESPHFRPFEAGTEEERAVRHAQRLVRTDAVLLADNPQLAFRYGQALARNGISDFLREYFGEEPAFPLLKGIPSCLQPSDGGIGGLGWHQDKPVFDLLRDAYRGPGPRWLNIWTALSRCGAEAPTLAVSPRRIDRVLSAGANYELLRIDPAVIDEISADVTPVVVQFEPGDALIFDEYLVHKTVRTRKMRYARYDIECWMAAPSTLEPHAGLLMV